jgi:hypothetical protein
MPGDFGKMPKYAQAAKQKLLFYGLSMHKLKVLKARNKFRHTLLL